MKNYIILTDENFQKEVLEHTQPVLVDFWADWCGPCTMISKTIDELAYDFNGKAKVGKVDIDKNPGVAKKFKINSIPTLLFFKDGQVEYQVSGVVSKAVMAEKLDKLIVIMLEAMLEKLEKRDKKDKK